MRREFKNNLASIQNGQYDQGIEIMFLNPTQGPIFEFCSEQTSQGQADIGQQAHKELPIDNLKGASVKFLKAMILLTRR